MTKCIISAAGENAGEAEARAKVKHLIFLNWRWPRRHLYFEGHGSNSSDFFGSFFLNKFFWSIVTLECCVSFCFSAR